MQEHKRGAGIDKETSETHRHFRSRPISIQNIIYEHREMMDFFFFMDGIVRKLVYYIKANEAGFLHHFHGRLKCGKL